MTHMNLSLPNQSCCLKAFSLIAILCLLFISCSESIVTEPDPNVTQIDTTVFVDSRSWSSLQTIDFYSSKQILFSKLLSLKADHEKLHALILIPQDTLTPPAQYGLDYLIYDNERWQHITTIQSPGIPNLGTIVPLPNNQAHIFRVGSVPELLEYPPDQYSSDLFYCFWDGVSCSGEKSLFSSPYLTFFRFYEAIEDIQGDVYLPISTHGYPSRTIHITQQGELLPSRSSGSLYSSIYHKNGSYVLSYIDSPEPPEGSNDVYLIKRGHSSEWSEPINIFHNPEFNAYHTSVLIDNEGNTHVAWYALDLQTGRVEVRHKVFIDERSIETLVMEYPYNYTVPLELHLDSHGIVHLKWSFSEIIPYDANYHATWKDKKWSEPERLFPEIKLFPGFEMDVDEDDNVHILFTSDSILYHAQYR